MFQTILICTVGNILSYECLYMWCTASPKEAHVLGSNHTPLLAVSGAEQAAEPKVMNPPMIHGLATPPTADCPAAQLVAAACGDGTISIWDLDKVCHRLLY